MLADKIKCERRGAVTSDIKKRWLYWTTEKKGAWQLIPDTEPDRNRALKSDAMFFTWATLSRPIDDALEDPVIRYGDLPLDFDDEKNPEKALDDLRRLCFIHLPELFDVDSHEIKYYCSGKKGFHAVIPAGLLGQADGDPYLPLIYKTMVTDWKERFNLPTIDQSLYCLGKGKMFRIENVKRANGRYKVPVIVEEVQYLPMKDLTELTRRPRNVD